MEKPFRPENQSLALGNKYRLAFNRIPEVTFFCQSVNIPGVSMIPTQFPTPFVDLPLPGDKIQYDELKISFLVDEDYKSWQSIYDWIAGMTFPESFDQYKNLAKLRRDTIAPGLKNNLLLDEKPQYSDAILTLNTNKNNVNIRFKFKDLFPVTLSPIVLGEQSSPENVIVCESSFRYSYFTLERI